MCVCVRVRVHMAWHVFLKNCSMTLKAFASVIRYCPQCKTDVSEVIRAGEKLRLSKKKASMVSKKQETNRDWGKVSWLPREWRGEGERLPS